MYMWTKLSHCAKKVKESSKKPDVGIMKEAFEIYGMYHELHSIIVGKYY